MNWTTPGLRFTALTTRSTAIAVRRTTLIGRAEYVVGFSPEWSRAPEKHKPEVRLRSKSLGQAAGGKRTLMSGRTSRRLLTCAAP
jgi:hypothetical protein